MTSDVTETRKAQGLQTVFDTLVAPKEAFETLRATPTWGWACIISIVLMIAGYFLQQPATQHAAFGSMQHAMATSPLYATMTDEQKQRALDRIVHPPAYRSAIGIIGVVVALFVATLLNALILLVANALGRGTATFDRLFAGSMNIAVPTLGIASVVLGIICRVLGADHFSTILDLARAMPGLALFTPGATGKLAAFLANIQVFTVWGFGLNTAMMRRTAQVHNALAWLFPLLITLAAAAAAAGATGLFGG
jgi:hypothetical protein